MSPFSVIALVSCQPRRKRKMLLALIALKVASHP